MHRAARMVWVDQSTEHHPKGPFGSDQFVLRPMTTEKCELTGCYYASISGQHYMVASQSWSTSNSGEGIRIGCGSQSLSSYSTATMIYVLVFAALGVTARALCLNLPQFHTRTQTETQRKNRNINYHSTGVSTVSTTHKANRLSNFAQYAIMAQTYTRDKTRDDYDDDRTGLVLDDFEQLLDSMVIFKKVFGDYDIPVKFEVPASNPWPSHLHGLRLGRRLEKLLSSDDFFSAYPEKVKELSKLGFNPSIESLVDDWRVIHDAMKVYKAVYGNLRVASKYEVPDEPGWPRYCRSVKLGVRVAAIRSAGRYVKDHPKRKQDLDDLGFEWRLRDSSNKHPVVDDLFEQVYEALVCYKREVDEELNVPTDFIVPSSDPWPESTRGLTLGIHVQSVRAKDKLVYGHEERERRLNELGFQWEETGRTVFSKKRFDIVYTALKAYKEVYGNLIVPQAFVVPTDDEFWPEEARGLKLGARVNAIRCQGTLVSNSPERRYDYSIICTALCSVMMCSIIVTFHLI